MENKHIHKWKRVYYRKVNPTTNKQDWVIVDGIFICDVCKQIKQLKTLEHDT